MRDLKIVVFDCDGVLFDSKEANRRYYNDLLKKFGHPAMGEDELEYVHTHSAEDSVRHIFQRCRPQIPEAEAYRSGLDYTPYLRFMNMAPGLVEFLSRIRKSCVTAISTNRTTTMPAVLEMSGLGPYFDMVVTALDVKNPKPHPEALLKILRHFGLRADEGIFIGDSEVDRDHAAAVGMEFIAFGNMALRAPFHAAAFEEVALLPPFMNA
jgi:phosphoglycolate phosphatase-like HAD superfamily hydrolase